MPTALQFVPPLIVIGLAVLWYLIGGLPFADHDEHGKVKIADAGDGGPAGRVDLPDGKTYLYFEEYGLSDDSSPDRPDGLKVTILPQGAGKDAAPVTIDEVPGFLFSSKTNSTGWEPYGKIDVPAGVYRVRAEAPFAYGSVTFGNPPINPFGPPIVGSILILLVFGGIPALIIWRRQQG
jgi:hypothetical protein